MIGSNPQRGFTLLIAVIMASVAISVGLALSSIAYKSVRLSDTAQSSQYAFYAADTALECALYADQKLDLFDFNTVTDIPANPPTCASNSGIRTINFTYQSFNSGAIHLFQSTWFPVQNGQCARLTIYKSNVAGQTYLYAEGVSTCNLNDPREIERGIYSNY